VGAHGVDYVLCIFVGQGVKEGDGVGGWVRWKRGVVQRNIWLIHDVGVLYALGRLLGEAFASEVAYLAAVEAGSFGPLRRFRPSCLGCITSGLVASWGAGTREIHGDWGVVHPARGVGRVVLGAPLLLGVAWVSTLEEGSVGAPLALEVLECVVVALGATALDGHDELLGSCGANCVLANLIIGVVTGLSAVCHYVPV
jgi:hypothetical protein